MFGKKIKKCNHEKYSQECFHSIWGFGTMCVKCKTVLHYTSHDQELPKNNNCEECHYHHEYYNKHNLAVTHKHTEIINQKKEIISVLIDFGMSPIESDSCTDSEQDFREAIRDIVEKANR